MDVHLEAEVNKYEEVFWADGWMISRGVQYTCIVWCINVSWSN